MAENPLVALLESLGVIQADSPNRGDVIDFYMTNRNDLNVLICHNWKDHPDAVLLYLLARNNQLEDRITAVQAELKDQIDSIECKVYPGCAD